MSARRRERDRERERDGQQSRANAIKSFGWLALEVTSVSIEPSPFPGFPL